MNPPRWVRCAGFVLVALVLFLMPPSVGALDRNNPAQVFLPTRLALSPLALGSIRELLERRLGRSVSLLLRPASSTFSAEDISSQTLLLTEFGVVPQGFPLECAPASLSCTLGWVLAAHRTVFDRIASAPPASLERLFETLRFARALREREVQGDVTYPWFESLFFPPSLRQIDRCCQGWKGRSRAEGDGTSGFLHLAMAEGLLNPLSVEADENLCNEVFEAGDAVFTTTWFPIDPAHPEVHAAIASDLVFMPFPGLDGPRAVPRVDLRLLVPTGSPDWTMLHPAPVELGLQKGGDSATIPEALFRTCPGFGSWTWEDCEARDEAEWAKDRFPELYGKLIRGGP